MKQLLLALLALPLPALAQDADYTLILANHRFEPAEITIPAGRKIELKVENRDTSPDEFDSRSLNREKVIAGNSSAIIFIGPLDPGRYPFQGEYNSTTAQGIIIAK